MALKDWKKIYPHKNTKNADFYRWLNMDEKRMLSVEKVGSYFLIYISTRNKKYGLYTSKDLCFYGKCYFKTKSQALKYAKEYMRKH